MRFFRRRTPLDQIEQVIADREYFVGEQGPEWMTSNKPRVIIPKEEPMPMPPKKPAKPVKKTPTKKPPTKKPGKP